MNQVNYLSDIKILENYPSTDSFVYHFTTTEESCYDVSLEIGNCRKDGDYLVICLDHHGLEEGQLKVRREFHFPDPDFPDKEWTKVCEHKYDIYLSEGVENDCEQYILPMYMPIFKGDKGDDGKDYIITEEDYDEIATVAVTKIDWDEVLKNKQDKLVNYTESNNNVSINGASFKYNDDNVVTSSMLPQLQTTYNDTFGHYINSDGYTDSNKCAVSSKNTTIFQSTETTGWSANKLLFRKGRWGDDGYSTIAIPEATETCDGALGFADKIKINKIDTIEETANDAYGKASFAISKIGDIYNDLGQVESKVREIELFKFPNTTIYGNPTIQQGQVSDFNEENYLGFPFIVDLADKRWILDFSFTLPIKLSKEQENIFDSEFGLAFAIRPFETNKYVLAYSNNGQSWNSEITFDGPLFTDGETVYIRIQNDGNGLQIFASLDKSNYTRYYYGNGINPFPKNIFIGKAILGRANYFEGSINLNDASLTINGVEVWRGMDDAGLSTRLATNLSNVDAEGVEKIKDIATYKNIIEDKGGTRISVNGPFGVNTVGASIFYAMLHSDDEKQQSIIYVNPRVITIDASDDVRIVATSTIRLDAQSVETFNGDKFKTTANEWYGTQAEFDALTGYIEDVIYYIY